jgi:hypothetical protein
VCTQYTLTTASKNGAWHAQHTGTRHTGVVFGGGGGAHDATRRDLATKCSCCPIQTRMQLVPVCHNNAEGTLRFNIHQQRYGRSWLCRQILFALLAPEAA